MDKQFVPSSYVKTKNYKILFSQEKVTVLANIDNER